MVWKYSSMPLKSKFSQPFSSCHFACHVQISWNLLTIYPCCFLPSHFIPKFQNMVLIMLIIGIPMLIIGMPMLIIEIWKIAKLLKNHSLMCKHSTSIDNISRSYQLMWNACPNFAKFGQVWKVTSWCGMLAHRGQYCTCNSSALLFWKQLEKYMLSQQWKVIALFQTLYTFWFLSLNAIWLQILVWKMK